MSVKSSALCLFDEADVQMDIIRTNRVKYTSTQKSDSTVEFNIIATPDEYVDLSDIRINLKLKIKKKDGKAWDAAKDDVAFINQPLSSIFKDVFLSLGSTQVEGGQHLYAYRAYLTSLLQFHPSAKKTHMEAWGWSEDTAGKFSDLTNNEGHKYRKGETEEGKTWGVEGPLFIDLTQQGRYLLPNVLMNFKFIIADADFALLGDRNNYKFEIVNMEMSVPRVRVMDSVLSGHNKGLEKHNAKYLLNHVTVTNFNINTGVQDHIQDNLFASQVPKLLVIGLLEHAAFNGDIKKNPFDFQHFGLNKIGLYRDGDLVPGQILTPDYDSDEYTRAYNHTMSALNYYNTDDSNGITMGDFKEGYNLYVYDLTPDNTAQSPHRHLMRTGSLRLEFGFAKALTKPITVLLFAILDAKLEITKMRDILISYDR